MGNSRSFVREFKGKQRLRDGTVIDVWGRETSNSMILSSGPLNGPYAMACIECDEQYGEWSTSENWVRSRAMKAGWKETPTGYQCPTCKS